MVVNDNEIIIKLLKRLNNEIKTKFVFGKTSNEWKEALDISTSNKYPLKRLFAIENTNIDNPLLFKYRIRLVSIFYESNIIELTPRSVKIIDADMLKLIKNIKIYVKNAITDNNSSYKIDYLEVGGL